MEAVKRYGWNLLIAIDQLANVLFGPLLNAVLPVLRTVMR